MIYRSAFILPVHLRNAANTLSARSDVRIDEGGKLNTLSAPLVPATGAADATPTHYACCGILTAKQRGILEQSKGLFSGAKWWRWHEVGTDEWKLVASFDSQHLGEPWNWQKCLQATGLKARSGGPQ